MRFFGQGLLPTRIRKSSPRHSSQIDDNDTLDSIIIIAKNYLLAPAALEHLLDPFTLPLLGLPASMQSTRSTSRFYFRLLRRRRKCLLSV